MSSKLLLLLSVIILIIVLGTTLLIKKPNLLTGKTNTQVSVSNNNQQNSIDNRTGKIVKVSVTAGGFQPKDLVVSPGDTVVWTNNTDSKVTVSSDVYPTNLLWKFLNLGVFYKGENVTATFSKAGRYRYHNDFNPDQVGTVTVK